MPNFPQVSGTDKVGTVHRLDIYYQPWHPGRRMTGRNRESGYKIRVLRHNRLWDAAVISHLYYKLDKHILMQSVYLALSLDECIQEITQYRSEKCKSHHAAHAE